MRQTKYTVRVIQTEVRRSLATVVHIEKSRRDQIKDSLDCVSSGPHVPGTIIHNTLF